MQGEYITTTSRGKLEITTMKSFYIDNETDMTAEDESYRGNVRILGEFPLTTPKGLRSILNSVCDDIVGKYEEFLKENKIG